MLCRLPLVPPSASARPQVWIMLSEAMRLQSAPPCPLLGEASPPEKPFCILQGPLVRQGWCASTLSLQQEVLPTLTAQAPA